MKISDAVLFLYFIVVAFQIVLCSKADILRQRKLPPCRACKTFIESFEKGMKKTARGKFEGGDAAWEEAKLGNYATSEIRLVEIQEYVCSEVEEGKDQCYSFHEEFDHIIEDWWFHHQNDEPNLYKFFCIDKIKHCCPDLHYGEDCTPCVGYPDHVCNNNGKCKGSGTRKGNGRCSCDLGYGGEQCNECAENYFEAYRDDKKLLCTKCHVSCDGSCTAAGPTGCNSCAAGWIKDNEKGCVDVNECAASLPVCSSQQFCVNTEGSYKCLECDRACAGCTGDGPDMCIRCASGYFLKEGICNDSEQEQRKTRVFVTRYLTYLGLCVATCIIFQRSVALAAAIGLMVAVYISVSEYMLNTPPTPDSADLAQQLLRATT